MAKYDPRTEKFEDLGSPQAVPEEYKNYTYITGNGVDAVGSKKATFAITAKDINAFDF